MMEKNALFLFQIVIFVDGHQIKKWLPVSGSHLFMFSLAVKISVTSRFDRRTLMYRYRPPN